jgi:hypothetical protein
MMTKWREGVHGRLRGSPVAGRLTVAQEEEAKAKARVRVIKARGMKTRGRRARGRTSEDEGEDEGEDDGEEQGEDERGGVESMDVASKADSELTTALRSSPPSLRTGNPESGIRNLKSGINRAIRPTYGIPLSKQLFDLRRSIVDTRSSILDPRSSICHMPYAIFNIRCSTDYSTCAWDTPFGEDSNGLDGNKSSSSLACLHCPFPFPFSHHPSLLQAERRCPLWGVGRVRRNETRAEQDTVL